MTIAHIDVLAVPAHLERASKIIDVLLEDAFKEPNVKICVNDGEETVVCSDAQTAKYHIFGVDESVLEIRTPEGRFCKGWVLLILDNDYDVMSDDGCGDLIERVMARANALAESFRNGQEDPGS